MEFKIHFTKGEYEDYFIVEGETIEDIRNAAREGLEQRNVTLNDDFWSEKIED